MKLLCSLLIIGVLGVSLAQTDKLTADIIRTSHNIPHITSDSWAGLGFGSGYTSVEDHLCTLALDLLRTSGESAKYLGGDEGRLETDAYIKALDSLGIVDKTLNSGGEFAPSENTRAFMQGVVKGYNQALETLKADAPCKDEPWLLPITEHQIWTQFLVNSTSFRAATDFLARAILAAQPPEKRSMVKPETTRATFTPNFPKSPKASNALALGKEATENGVGLLLGNPHLGTNEYTFLQHWTIPGELDAVAGIYWPFYVAQGFSDKVAWSQEYWGSQADVYYELTLDPTDPLTYLVDGEKRSITPITVSVEVLGEDGTLETVEQTLYRSHHGFMVAGEDLGLEWTNEKAYTLRELADNNLRWPDMQFGMLQAQNVDGMWNVAKRWQATVTEKLLAVDTSGRTVYIPSTLSINPPENFETCVTSEVGQVYLEMYRALFDGSRTECDLVVAEGTLVPGSLPFSEIPVQFTDSYVVNANTTPSLVNADAPRPGLPYFYNGAGAAEGAELSPRLRSFFKTVRERLDGTDGLPGKLFTLENLKARFFASDNYLAYLFKDELVVACKTTTSAEVEGEAVNLEEACNVLEAWDGSGQLDSRGAVLFRLWLNGLPGGSGDETTPAITTVAFDPNDPLETPRGLDTSNPVVLGSLASAVLTMQEAGVPLDVPLSEVQRWQHGEETYALSGCTFFEGCVNTIDAFLEPPPGGDAEQLGEPLEFVLGLSFLWFTQLSQDGLIAEIVDLNSQNDDPASPYFNDQTLLASQGQTFRLPFTPEEIQADMKRQYSLEENE
jgi:acyl-homoserine-lactone acylase